MKRLAALAAASNLIVGVGVAVADPAELDASTFVLQDLRPAPIDIWSDVVASPPARRGLIVPTPWGDVEARIVSTPVDRMLRVPLAAPSEPGQDRAIQPYFTAGSRKDVDADPVLEQAKASGFGDSGRTSLKAGAGVSLRLDTNVELFGEYQFMRLHRPDGRGAAGPLGTTLDAGGFSIGLSVRY